jgi:hypothetical protein
MKSRHFLLLLLPLFFLGATAKKTTSDTDTQPPSSLLEPALDPAAAPTPSLRPASSKPKTYKNQNSKVIEIHKPMPSPAWGRVLQYHREKVVNFSEKNQETLHEFLFQDEEGVIRTALFHEYASGEGYWEVWIWDQP